MRKNGNTIKDVAELAGVSSMSVSLAFKDSRRVGEATKKRIFEAARQLNYVPNQAARQLRSGTTDLVGFLVPDLSNPFHTIMIRHAENAFRKMGLTLFAASCDWNAELEYAFAERLIQMRARGVLICPCEKDFRAVGLLERAGIPCVALDSVPDSYAGPCVVNDLAMCGGLMAEHFHAIGAREIAYVDAAPEMLCFSAFRRTREAFFAGLAQYGLTVKHENCLPCGMTLEAGAEAFRLLKKNGFSADAVFCVNDLCALGLMDEASKQGLAAGRDFALAGIDDLEISALDRISLTSIRQPYGVMAEESVRMLWALMDGADLKKKKKMLPQSLCVRGSTLHFCKN